VGSPPGVLSRLRFECAWADPVPREPPSAEAPLAQEFVTQTSALGLVLAAWLLLASACLGLGLLWYRAWRTPVASVDRLVMAFWVGLALAIGVLQLAHFAVPIGAGAGIALLIVAGISLARERRALRLLVPEGSAARWAAGGCALLVACLAVAGLRPLEHYDTGLYLLGAMSWFGDYALVPGLGNLHGRFAFNNSHLLVASVLDVGPWSNRAHHLMNGGLMAAFVVGGLHAGRGLFAPDDDPRAGRASAAFALVMIVPAVLLSHRYLVSLSTDFPVTLVALVVAWRGFRLLAGEAEGAARVELRDVTLLSAAGVCIKLSALVFLGGVWLLALLVVARDADRSGRSLAYDVVPALAIAGLMMLPWLVRGVVLSGYPLYPSSLVSWPVDWRVPVSSVDSEAAGVRAWARVPGVPRELTLSGWYWTESWMRRHLVVRVGVGFPLPLLLGAAGVAIAAVGGSLGRHSRATRGLALILPAALAFAFWFWMAPDPRFALFVFWTIAAAGLAAAVGVWRGAWLRPGWCLALLVSALLVLSLERADLDRPRGFTPIPEVPTEKYQTAAGLEVRVPIGSDQCWGAVQPCTPHRRPELTLRRPGELASGFSRGG
jgi:hypothetical protein